ncbi:hypothetical protein GA707_20345 [Nostocoides sp. F2B08]|uniref:hypothetical protein n=1 Tax=Nostocoides sp. F2B08 TaxID=2653936 RepID=UPI0012639D17|nr:hypothetical protein [Tetrasphaera sp. F2B08]KAB7739557.1 hypothetical protein GA707_20345 [Tetrasphaera sp. F2B08]
MANFVCGWLLIAVGLGTMVWVDFLYVWADPVSARLSGLDIAGQVLFDLLLVPGAYSLLVRPKIMVDADTRWTVVNPFSRWDFMEDEIQDIKDAERFQRIVLKSGKRILCFGAEESLWSRMRGSSSVRSMRSRGRTKKPELRQAVEGGFSLDLMQVVLLLLVIAYYMAGAIQSL